MKISKPSIFLMSMIIAGCQTSITQTKNQYKSNTRKSESKEIVTKSVPTLSCDSIIVNNKFSLNTLAFKVFKADTTEIKSLFIGPVLLKLEKQKNSEGGSYDLYDFTDGINKLVLYRNDGFYIEEGVIENNKALLNRKMSIGMTKDKFLQLVNITNIKCDTIIVQDEESTFETIYIFNDSKLKKIKMGQIVE